MERQAPLIAVALAALAGCSSAPFGQVLVNVDSEPTVPQLVGRLRIDLYTTDGVWYESRDVVTPDPSSWPVSFDLFTDQPGTKHVRLRLRAFREAALRDYQGERFDTSVFVEPPSAHNLGDLCTAPPLLPPGKSVTFRRPAHAVTELVAQNDCKPPTKAGSVAARIEIAAAGTYHFAVIPDIALQGYLAGDTTLFLRTACGQPATQVQCNDDVDHAAGILTSAFDADLKPGTYFLLTGGGYASPLDVTLRWDEAASFVPLPPPQPVYGVPGKPLAVDGAPTPTGEPQPNLAIDRMVDVDVEFGAQRTTDVMLRGECLGTQADLFGGRTCVDTAATLTAVDHAPLRDGIERAQASAQGSWAGERVLPCGVAPRPRSSPIDGIEALDEEVCVPGGAFVLGDARVVGITIDAVPERVVVLEPFLLDKYEYTVARYRRARADGFVSPDDSPWAWESELNSANGDINSPSACTFSEALLDRETLPLTCVSWYTARALCRFEGGDLPTHAQWEYAATAAGRPTGTKSLYPWGDDTPTCQRTVYARGGLDSDCIDYAAGPQPVDAEPWASGDLTPVGASGLGGNAGEWVIDSLRDYRDPCWFAHALHGVGCDETEAVQRSGRGGAWPIEAFDLRAATLSGFAPGVGNFVMGFRCARRGTP